MARLFHPQSDIGYHGMVWIFRIMDLFGKPDRRLHDFDIKKGSVVVDYGCGPGRYIQKASHLVGPEGRVYAVDINRIAINLVKNKIRKNKLDNVVPVLIGDHDQPIADHCADVVYALDMFHQIDDPATFLAGIHRITQKNGLLFLEDGHQTREKTLKKIASSDLWQVTGQTRRHVALTACGP